MAKGKFFVIDGTDGSGKKTQTALLVERLRREGHPVRTIAFPRYGEPSAAAVKAYLEGAFGDLSEVGPKQGSILYAVDRYGASRQIRAWLEAGDIVVADRYVAANMGHQGGKIADPEERAAFFRWNDDLEYGIFGIPRPDINVILHVPADVAMGLVDHRGNTKDIHENSAEHIRAAERVYLEIARDLPGFALVECTEGGKLLPEAAVHELVWKRVSPMLR